MSEKGFLERLSDGLSDAIEERTGLRSWLRGRLDEPIRGGPRWGAVFGASLVALLVVEAITGFALSTVYAPSSQTAWASVHHVEHGIAWGSFVRAIHHFGSHAIVALVGVHLVRTAIVGAYKRPREVSWLLGLALLGVVAGLALTGGRLPWDQQAYWATKVEVNIISTFPVIGTALSGLVLGGSQAGHLTVTRFHGLHVAVFPVLLLVLVLAHLAIARRHGPVAKAGDTTVSPRSRQLARDAIASVVIVGAVIAFAFAKRAPLAAPADPSSDFPARPEWFLLPLFELRKFFHGPAELIATAVLPGLATAFLIFLPFLDRRPDAPMRARAPFVVAIAAGLLGGGALLFKTKLADAKDEKLQKAFAVAEDRAQRAAQLAKAGVPPEGPLEMLARDPQTRGEELWKQECATCHTIDGKLDAEATAPDLKDWGTAAWAEAVVRDPDAELYFGKTFFKGEMPSFTKAPKGKEAEFKPMPDADVKAVAAFVAGKKDPRGAEVFDDACGGCHDMNGKGGGDSELAPKLGGWGGYAWLRAQIADPASGATYPAEASSAEHKGHMPGFAKDLGHEVELIAQWVFWKTQGRWPTPEEIASANPPAAVASAPSASSAPPAASTAPEPGGDDESPAAATSETAKPVVPVVAPKPAPKPQQAPKKKTK